MDASGLDTSGLFGSSGSIQPRPALHRSGSAGSSRSICSRESKGLDASKRVVWRDQTDRARSARSREPRDRVQRPRERPRDRSDSLDSLLDAEGFELPDLYDQDICGGVFSNIPVGLIIARADGAIEMSNHEVRKLLGYGPEELEQENLSELMPESQALDHDLWMERCATRIELQLCQAYTAKLEGTPSLKDGTSAKELYVVSEQSSEGSPTEPPPADPFNLFTDTLTSINGFPEHDATHDGTRSERSMAASTWYMDEPYGELFDAVQRGEAPEDFWKFAHESLLQTFLFGGKARELPAIDKWGNVVPIYLRVKPFILGMQVGFMGVMTDSPGHLSELQELSNFQQKLLSQLMIDKHVDLLIDDEVRLSHTTDMATVLYVEIIGYHDLLGELDPTVLFLFLRDMYGLMDKIVLMHPAIEKVRSSGEGYMAVCGLHDPIEDHANIVLRAAQDILDLLALYNKKVKAEEDVLPLVYTEHEVKTMLNEDLTPDEDWRNKVYPVEFGIGINTGQVMGATFDLESGAYDVVGEAIKVAIEVAANAPENGILISDRVYMSFDSANKSKCKEDAKLSIPGMAKKGKVMTYVVNDPKENES